MASRRDYALAVKMTFDGSQAETGMRRTHLHLQRMQASAQLMKQGFSDIGSAMTRFGAVGIASAGIAAVATKRYADFADQMAAVKSVFLGKLPEKQFKQMTKLAEKLGATTRFTATEAGSAMESLARSGMKPLEVMKAIRPVLAAAAAENIPLASAADIVASNLKAFSMPATQAARAADALAYVSANTNTNMLQLQEGLKMASATAKFAGVSFEDTTAALGIMADIGLKGSLGGTAIKNAIIKLSQNAKKGSVMLGKYRVEIAKNKSGGLDLAKTFQNVSAKMAMIKDPMTRVKAAMKLFGIRGANAAGGFDSMLKSMKKLKPGEVSKMALLFDNMRKRAKGSADLMRRIRLNTIKGDFILLGSAVDGVAQAFGGALAPSIRGALGEGGKGGLIGTISAAAQAFQYFAEKPEQVWKKGVPKIKGVKATMASMIQGVLRGVEDVRQVFAKVGYGIKDTMRMIGLLDKGTSGSSARMVVKIGGIAAGVAALGLALKGAIFLFGGVATAAVGTFKVVVGGLGLFKAALFGAATGLTGFKAAVVATATKVAAMGWGGAALAVAKFAGGIAIAGAAGYGLGRMLDRWTGLSSKMATWMDAAYGAVTGRSASAEAATKKRLRAGGAADIVKNMILVQQTAQKAGKRATIAFRGKPKERFRVTRELAVARIKAQLKREGVHEGSREYTQVMAQISDKLSQLKTAQELKISVKINEREVGRAVKMIEHENKTRGIKEKGKLTSQQRLSKVGHAKK